MTDNSNQPAPGVGYLLSDISCRTTVIKISRHRNPSFDFRPKVQEIDSALRLLISIGMSINGAAEGSARVPPPTSMSPVRATELSRALSARDHLLLSDQGSHGLTAADPLLPSVRHPVAPPFDLVEYVLHGIRRRWARERRRRTVGRAYDMASEIARVIPRGSEVLDVGCGNGFIAHHLTAMLGTSVIGIDLGNRTDAAIDYRRYDGAQFPTKDDSFDAVLLCYVLHHAQDVRVMLREMRRVLRNGGLAIIYEDLPLSAWDRAVCWFHSRLWRERTGPCSFRLESDWRALFNSFGFEILAERPLSRWRNLTHPVSRRLYVLKLPQNREEVAEESRPHTRPCRLRHARAGQR